MEPVNESMSLMSEPSTSASDMTSDPSPGPASDEPQFGLLDVVEAFTAMRHEWRTQSRENRGLADSILASTELLKQIESTLDQKLTATTHDGLQNMISLVIELDTSLQRAVDALDEQKTAAEQRDELVQSLNLNFEKSGWLNRRFGKKFLAAAIELVNNSVATTDPLHEGMRLVLHRLHRTMDEQGLARIDPLGKPFDGETMQAISSVSSDQTAAGHVADVIAPAYVYRGKLIRFAEVRVAK